MTTIIQVRTSGDEQYLVLADRDIGKTEDDRFTQRADACPEAVRKRVTIRTVHHTSGKCTERESPVTKGDASTWRRRLSDFTSVADGATMSSIETAGHEVELP